MNWIIEAMATLSWALALILLTALIAVIVRSNGDE
jgi:hypothetical protein